ncbi:MAG: SusD/RagB family nutrient-binding outer membrane lipoprotein [Bacteroidia bacterium]|nr:SusD/RagB family nutrient-binding outer membrane lipoprotein [Bacteroidia bacterium]
MKRYLFLLLTTLLLASSCEYTELDLYDNPNAAQPNDAEVKFLYNNIQLTFKDIFEESWKLAPLSRMGHTSYFRYEEAFPAQIGDQIWKLAYSGLFPDVDAIEALTVSKETYFELGSSQVMKAYAMFALVDIFGDVPFKDAGLGTDIISPSSEKGEIIYQKAIDLLEEAITVLEKEGTIAISVDNFYQGDQMKWITLAKTLKLRAYLNTFRVDEGAKQKIQEILDEGDIIDEEAEDFNFRYGNNSQNPNTQHPFYSSTYGRDDLPYMSNYFMWLVAAEKGIQDPRTRFYFYRQKSNSLNADPNIYSCVYNSGPPDANSYPGHYREIDSNLPYCVASQYGYYGRDHMNGSAIPPDENIRSGYGMYPGGGAFDKSLYESLAFNSDPGLFGAGIAPIYNSSFTYFQLAEFAVEKQDIQSAWNQLEMAIEHSFQKLDPFIAQLDTSQYYYNPLIQIWATLREVFFPNYAETQLAYIEAVKTSFEAATNKEQRLDIISKEYLIALWGNALDAYNLYRRTGLPLNIQPAISPPAGEFPRTLLYPSVHVNRNENANQKALSTPVFWDTNDGNIFQR